ncbi:amino acid ABC transporter ATP-binding protein, partial [Rhizobium ruizarguesonis]
DLVGDDDHRHTLGGEIGFAATVGQQIVFLDHGKVLFNGSPQDVFKRPRNPRLEQFLDTYIDSGASMLL